ncbi:hypothetical protein DPMN_050843 [Dreissena polymorpha]|uniref:Uncharacterized protein n=1 Tax=Dreissena polymorpha TaxID=45954 RepID=A0A9D4CIN7_DREPO|nr:hypothetical protein DPMN_050843 [Dreissena polymorpha]
MTRLVYSSGSSVPSKIKNLPDPEPRKKVYITDDMIAQVTCIGFEVEMARLAL